MHGVTFIVEWASYLKMGFLLGLLRNLEICVRAGRSAPRAYRVATTKIIKKININMNYIKENIV